jgi:hypothetical protein
LDDNGEGVVDFFTQDVIENPDDIVYLSDKRCYSKETMKDFVKPGAGTTSGGRHVLPLSLEKMTNADYDIVGAPRPTATGMQQAERRQAAIDAEQLYRGQLLEWLAGNSNLAFHKFAWFLTDPADRQRLATDLHMSVENLAPPRVQPDPQRDVEYAAARTRTEPAAVQELRQRFELWKAALAQQEFALLLTKPEDRSRFLERLALELNMTVAELNAAVALATLPEQGRPLIALQQRLAKWRGAAARREFAQFLTAREDRPHLERLARELNTNVEELTAPPVVLQRRTSLRREAAASDLQHLAAGEVPPAPPRTPEPIRIPAPPRTPLVDE